MKPDDSLIRSGQLLPQEFHACWNLVGEVQIHRSAVEEQFDIDQNGGHTGLLHPLATRAEGSVAAQTQPGQVRVIVGPQRSHHAPFGLAGGLLDRREGFADFQAAFSLADDASQARIVRRIRYNQRTNLS